jgi:DNA modification methylase
MPESLAETYILAGSRPGNLVLDPFAGAGTTLATARKLGRRWLGIELNPSYEALICERLAEQEPALVLRSGRVAGENSGDLAGALPRGVRR